MSGWIGMFEKIVLQAMESMICTAMHSVPSRLSDNDARAKNDILSVAFTKVKIGL